MSLTIQAVQTGLVKIKKAQRVRKPGGLIRVLTDSEWTEWLPIFAWVIDHPEGIFVVDTGDTARTLEPGYFPSWHPYYRGSLQMDIKPEQEIGPQLKKMGIKPAEIKTLILTHFHTDHAGGLPHFPETNILVSSQDLKIAHGFKGKMRGYLPQHWPSWFTPQTISFDGEAYASFDTSHTLTEKGDIRIVPTPGHTPGHISVVVEHEDVCYFLAGDTSYDEGLLLNRQPDGVSPKASVTLDTIERIISLARTRPTVYLPTHDPQSTGRLKNKTTVALQNQAEATS